EDTNDGVTSSSGTVTLKVTGPKSYSKEYTANAVSGVATFSGLDVLSMVGNYTFTATDVPDGLSPAVASETVWAPHLAFTRPPQMGLFPGQDPGTVVVSVEDIGNNVMSGSSAAVTLTVTGPGNYSKVYAATASSGVATFSSLAALTLAGNYSYTATDVPDGFTQVVATEAIFGPPSAVSVTPSSGHGTTQRFSFVASSPNGAAYVNEVYMLFNTSLSPVKGCYVGYSARTSQLWLVSDVGATSSQGQPGTAGTLSNSQCSVDVGATTVVPNGNTLTVSPVITFKSGFTAGIQIYMNVIDTHGKSTGLTKMGWWMVGSSPEQ